MWPVYVCQQYLTLHCAYWNTHSFLSRLFVSSTFRYIPQYMIGGWQDIVFQLIDKSLLLTHALSYVQYTISTYTLAHANTLAQTYAHTHTHTHVCKQKLWTHTHTHTGKCLTRFNSSGPVCRADCPFTLGRIFFRVGGKSELILPKGGGGKFRDNAMLWLCDSTLVLNFPSIAERIFK